MDDTFLMDDTSLMDDVIYIDVLEQERLHTALECQFLGFELALLTKI